MSDHEASGTKGGQTTSSTPCTGETEIPLVLWEELRKIFDDPNEWLDTLNPAFGYVTPRSLIVGGQSERVLNRVRAYQHGIFS